MCCGPWGCKESALLVGDCASRDLDDMKKLCKGSEAERNWVTSECPKKSAEAETKRGRREVGGRGGRKVPPPRLRRALGTLSLPCLGVNSCIRGGS